MNPKQKRIHDQALIAGNNFHKAEAEIIQVLQEVEREKVHRGAGKKNLLMYAMDHMGLSEPVALQFIAVARKAVEVPELKAAVKNKTLTASAANRLVSVITRENASEIISFASTHTWRETEREVARRNPRAANPDKVKFISDDLIQVTVTISKKEYEDFERVCSLEAQRRAKAPTRGEAFSAANQAYLEKNDPVRKAVRAEKRQIKRYSVRTDQNAEKPSDSKPSFTRVDLTAAQVHAVSLRDQGRCTHVDANGKRCNEDRWTEIHHIIEVSKGGTNDPENLTTLCSFHHDLIHQLSLSIEGQFNWLPKASSPPLK